MSSPSEWTVSFESLATQCRDQSFRESLKGSDCWTNADDALAECINKLDSLIHAQGTKATSDASNEGDGQDEDGFGYTFNVAKNANESEALTVEQSDIPRPTIEEGSEELVKAYASAATSAFRFLRNACAACPRNQQLCRSHDLLPKIHAMITKVCLWMDVEENSIKSSVVLLGQVALQSGVNMITGCEENQKVVWRLFFPNDCEKLLVECHEQRKVIAFTAALLLNCVSSNTDEASERCLELVCHRNIVVTLLQRFLVQSNTQHSQMPSSSEIDEDDPAFEWLSALFHCLFHSEHIDKMFNAVGAHLLSRLWSRVTPEQLILLRIFTTYITSSGSKGRSDTNIEFVLKTWKAITIADNEDRPDDVEEGRKEMWQQLENAAKLLLLDCIGDFSLDSHFVLSSIGTEALRSLLQELQRVWLEGRDEASTGSTLRAGMTVLSKHEPQGYRSSIIRACGNLVFRHRDHQDLVRDEGYLPLFLNHCNIDDNNPLIREWSLVALRHLCEGNEENQAYISALKPQGMDSTSEDVLERNGVEANVQDGQVHMRRT